MYTRCPSCRAEISFEPPANASNLPDGYKHKIKCPSCGVTIGVKIPKVTSDIQPTFIPQNPNAVPSEPVLVATDTTAPEKAEKSAEPRKVYGRVRNSVIIVLSALVAIICALGYLVTSNGMEFAGSAGLAIFDGISPIINLIGGNIDGEPLQILVQLLPSITLVLAVINLIVAITTLAVGVYSKVFNLISGLLIAGASVATIFTECFISMFTNKVDSINVIEYLKNDIIDGGKYLVFVGALFGLAILACSIAFLFVSNHKKPKAE